MSRVAASDVIVVKPKNNIYTALIAIAMLAELIAFFLMFTRAGEIFGEGKGLFN